MSFRIEKWPDFFATNTYQVIEYMSLEPPVVNYESECFKTLTEAVNFINETAHKQNGPVKIKVFRNGC